MITVSDRLGAGAEAVLLHGDSGTRLAEIESGSVDLVITSPPYNIGKAYEARVALEAYLAALEPILAELHRVLAARGSLVWQVGNFVEAGELFPLDIWFYPIFKRLGFKLRNRVVWHFDHGLHATHRLSGRYETLLWFTKSDAYTWNLDPIRVPAKYPGKRNYKPGPNRGLPSGNPLGKNPSDVWKLRVHEWEVGLWDIPNVKANHPEKTLHPCSFPIELVERCVLSMTDEGHTVLDPFSGVGSASLAALKHGRRSIGIEREAAYLEEARRRIRLLENGSLPYRPLGKPVHVPTAREKVAQIPEEWRRAGSDD